jgi:hypothetical protein
MPSTGILGSAQVEKALLSSFQYTYKSVFPLFILESFVLGTSKFILDQRFNLINNLNHRFYGRNDRLTCTSAIVLCQSLLSLRPFLPFLGHFDELRRHPSHGHWWCFCFSLFLSYTGALHFGLSWI